MKLNRVVKVEGVLELVSGLHIGNREGEVRIGGMDNPVIRDAATNQPYIPGSSIKGKMRSLLEWYTGAIDSDGAPATMKLASNAPKKAEAELLVKVFGSHSSSERDCVLGPTRVVFRDLFLEPAWLEKTLKRGIPVTEVKMENMIDRVKGTAVHPRNTERVIRGARFVFGVSWRVLDGDDPEAIAALVKRGLALLQCEGLGGAVSRGYGRIRFESLQCDGKEFTLPNNPFADGVI
jgi:CRISPR-associated protein Csm3